MPVTTFRRTVKKITSEQVILGASYTTVSDVIIYDSSIDKPTSTRRVKPLDLFRNGTFRRVMSWKRVCLQPKVTYTGHPANFTRGYTFGLGDLGSLQENKGLRPLAFGADFNALMTRLLLKIKAQKVNLGVSVPELGKTTDMVAGLARDIYGAFRSVRSGTALPELHRYMKRMQYARHNDRAQRRLASRWLEYCYGWTPLMQDIYNLADQISKDLIEGKTIQVQETEKGKAQFASPYNPGNPVSQDFLKRKVKARYRVDSTGLKTLSEIGLTNPALIVWELVPYSFVVDWVVDISSYLSALDALVGTTDFICLQSSQFLRFQSQSNQKDAYTVDVGSIGLSERITQRNLPQLDVKGLYPQYKPHVSVKRMVSAVSLLRLNLNFK